LITRRHVALFLAYRQYVKRDVLQAVDEIWYFLWFMRSMTKGKQETVDIVGAGVCLNIPATQFSIPEYG
jgi:hypothetical protein